MKLLPLTLFVIIVVSCCYHVIARQPIVTSIFTNNPTCDKYIGGNYSTFQHIKTGKLLSVTGVATDRFTKRNVFQVVQYYYIVFPGVIKDPTVSGMAFYTRPWFNTTEHRLYAMDIEGGCLKNAEIKTYFSNKLAKNRLFKIYDDGSIGTTCNPEADGNWRLIIDDRGRQIMKDINEVSKDDIHWKISNFPEIRYVPE